jgi:phosphoglycolate phosphatase-like HAD superfamily hydrolase
VAAPTVLLFDIDGTLLNAAGAGRRALRRAFAHHGWPGDLYDTMKFHGLTDRAIVRAGLRHGGLAEGDEVISAVLETYAGFLEDEVLRSEGFVVHPGVEAALAAAAATADVALGVGTGNVRPGARAKLRRGGLAERFAFGGYGCDHEERAEILALGAARGAAHLGVPRDRCRVVVIGDTPRDVAAARDIGAESIGVGTGGTPLAELHAAGATWAFADLTAGGVLDALLGARRG